MVSGLLALFPVVSVRAQVQVSLREGASIVAFQNVTLISMERNAADDGQTVIVQGDRIIAIGNLGSVTVPAR